MALLQDIYPMQKRKYFYRQICHKIYHNASLRNLLSVLPQKIDLFAGKKRLISINIEFNLQQSNYSIYITIKSQQMKKNYYLLLLVMVLSVAGKAQTDWVSIKLDEKIAVKFPYEPEKKVANGSVSYVSKTKDSVTYGAVVLDYNVIAHLDSATLALIKDTQQFADQTKAGIVSQKKNYIFGDITIGKWKTFTTYSMLGTNTTNKNKVSLKMILIGSKMYSLSCLVPDEPDAKNSAVFLDSVELLKP